MLRYGSTQQIAESNMTLLKHNVCTIWTSQHQPVSTADCSDNPSWNDSEYNVIPTTIARLILKNNSLYHIPTSTIRTPSALVYLDLSWNLIAKIDKEDFANLTRLRTLKLSNNRLCLGYDSFPATAFQHLTMLRTLFLHANRCQYSHRTYPDLTLAELPKLEYLSMSALRNVDFGVGFLQLRHLQTLSLIGYSVCHIESVSRSTFQNLRRCNLTHLHIKSCYLKYMSSFTFEPLTRLTHINLSCNRELGFSVATAVLRASNSCRFHTVIIDGIQSSFEPVILRERDFDAPSMRSLERLTFRADRIFAIDVRFLRYLPAIKYVAGSFNCPRLLLPPDTWVADWLELQHMTSLETVDASYWCEILDQYHRSVCRDDDMAIDDYFRTPRQYVRAASSKPKSLYNVTTRISESNWWQSIPTSLKHLYFHTWSSATAIDITALDVKGKEDLLLLNVSFVNIRRIIGPVRGLSHLQVLDLRHCQLEMIAADAFKYFTDLRFLFLQGNRIGTQTTIDLLKNSFAHLRALEELDLRHNALTRLHHATFSDLVSLRTLRLDWNSLAHVNFSTSGLASLELLNLAHNGIAYLTKEFLADLPGTNNVRVILSGNVLICTCASMPFLSWFHANREAVKELDELTCTHDSGVMYLHDVNLTQMLTTCSSTDSRYTIPARDTFHRYVISAVAVFLLVAALSLTALRHRWKVRWKWFLCKQRLRSWRHTADNSGTRPDHHIFDAFVSYCTEQDCDDHLWVGGVLVPMLEVKWGLQLCIVGRNNVCGSKVRTVVDALYACRRTIIVLSPKACRDVWCNYAFHMTLEKGDEQPILVCLKSLTPTQIPKAIRRIIMNNEQLDWPLGTSAQATFWKKIKQAMRE